ncbi:MAG: hypothetical protein N2484_13450 [Clostridia bacterium]|nr:hypothetical protein [Clostridia bacterium]
MEKRNRRWIGLLILLIAALILLNSRSFSFFAPDEIDIAARLKANDTPGTNGEKYVLEMEITKNAWGNTTIYPYLPGFGAVSIYESQNNTPLNSRARLDQGAKRLAISKLKQEDGIEGVTENTDLEAFSIASQKGSYQCKIFYFEHNGSIPMDRLYIVCVHKEKTLWKDLSWAKVIPVKNELGKR